MTDDKLCACGKPLHYSDPLLQKLVEQQIEDMGECVIVNVAKRMFLVPRHYIALHGIKGWELPTMGFEEVPDA